MPMRLMPVGRRTPPVGARAPLPAANWTRYERGLLGVQGPAAVSAHAMAEASREARRTSGARDAVERGLVEVAAGVAAPFLVSYVDWVLARAAEQGVDRLYFLARDGQVLHRLAEAVGASAGLDIELYYLRASRVTLNLAAASELTDETIPWLLTGLRRQSVVSLCERLHITPEELAPTSERLGIAPDAWDAPLGQAGAARMHDALLEPANARLVEGRARELRTRTEPYLRSVGFLEPGVVGIVDLGGAGSQLYALGRFREQAGLDRPVGYLVYRDHGPLEARDRDGSVAGCSTLNVHLAEVVSPHDGPRVTGFVPLLETFCAADHGRVIDYVPGATSIEVVTEQQVVDAVQEWGLPMVRAVMLTMVAELLRALPPGVRTDGLLPPLSANLQTFIREPTRSEAQAWGSFPLAVSPAGDTSVLGPIITLRALVELVRTRRSLGGLSRWWPGSLARSPRHLRIVLALVGGSRRLSRGVRRSG